MIDVTRGPEPVGIEDGVGEVRTCGLWTSALEEENAAAGYFYPQQQHMPF